MNDLIGLEYGWGHSPNDGSGKTDCFQLVCEVRRRLGLFDYAPLFDWVYQQHTEESFTSRILARLLLQNGKRTNELVTGCVVLFSEIKAALGTVTDYGIIYVSPGGHVAHSAVPSSSFHCIKMNR
jgi:hypothetical protein